MKLLQGKIDIMNNLIYLQEALSREIHFHSEFKKTLLQKRTAILKRDITSVMEASALIDTLVLEADHFRAHREELIKAMGPLTGYKGSSLSEFINVLDPLDAEALHELYKNLIHIFDENKRLSEQTRFLSQRLLQVAADLLQIFSPGKRMQVYTPNGLLTRYQSPASNQLEILA